MVSYSSTGTERNACRCIICKCRICIIWLVFGKVSVFISFFLRISLQFNMFNFAVIFPRHVEGQKLDRTVWNLSTFHAYVSYHVKVGVSWTKPMFFSFFFVGLPMFFSCIHKYNTSSVQYWVMTMLLQSLIWCHKEHITIFYMTYNFASFR